MAETSIEWTASLNPDGHWRPGYTFNPWWGCVNVSPACDHCYAESIANRYFPGLWGKDKDRRFFGDVHWEQPLRWNAKAAKQNRIDNVFCGSMCDIMEDKPGLRGERSKLYKLIQACPNLRWLLLTKRPQNFLRFLPEAWLFHPLQNVVGMTTVESNAYLWRVEALQRTSFVYRGLSCEPLLGFLDLESALATRTIHWIIAGGESGSAARPSHPDWFRHLRDLCSKHQVPFFFKQWGNFQLSSDFAAKRNLIVLNDGAAGQYSSDFDTETRLHWNEFRPEMMACVGKKQAGMLLDGVLHKEQPF